MKITNEMIETAETSFDKFVLKTLQKNSELVEDIVLHATPTLFVASIIFDEEISILYKKYQVEIDSFDFDIDDIDDDDDIEVEKFLNAFVLVTQKYFTEEECWNE